MKIENFNNRTLQDHKNVLAQVIQLRSIYISPHKRAPSELTACIFYSSSQSKFHLHEVPLIIAIYTLFWCILSKKFTRRVNTAVREGAESTAFKIILQYFTRTHLKMCFFLVLNIKYFLKLLFILFTGRDRGGAARKKKKQFRVKLIFCNGLRSIWRRILHYNYEFYEPSFKFPKLHQEMEIKKSSRHKLPSNALHSRNSFILHFPFLTLSFLLLLLLFFMRC